MFLSIAEDKHIPKLKELTDAIHAEDGKAGIQLWQGGLTVGMDQTARILLSSDTELAPGFTVPGISKEKYYKICPLTDYTFSEGAGNTFFEGLCKIYNSKGEMVGRSIAESMATEIMHNSPEEIAARKGNVKAQESRLNSSGTASNGGAVFVSNR